MTLDLARSCSTYVTTIINGADLIPTVSAGQSAPSLARAPCPCSALLRPDVPLLCCALPDLPCPGVPYAALWGPCLYLLACLPAVSFDSLLKYMHCFHEWHGAWC